jgi:arylformamidase
MKIIDISMEINEHMMVYKDKDIKKPIFKTIQSHKDSDIYETNMTINLHTGTHVDAPLHIINNGNTVEKYSLEQFMGEAYVIDLTYISDCITYKDLSKKNINENDIILLKTSNSYENTFNYNYIYLDESGADYLSNKKVKLVGIDGLGIERAQPNHNTHKILLQNNIPIIEGLRLKDVEERKYQFIGLPLKISGVEASPVRAILIC